MAGLLSNFIKEYIEFKITDIRKRESMTSS